jgi:hypothetical protein
MRFTTVIATIFAATLFCAGAANAQMGLPDMGKAAASAVGDAAKSTVDSAKSAVSGATDSVRGAAGKLTKPKVSDEAKAAAAKECASQAESNGLIGKALHKFVSNCKKTAGKS